MINEVSLAQIYRNFAWMKYFHVTLKCSSRKLNLNFKETFDKANLPLGVVFLNTLMATIQAKNNKGNIYVVFFLNEVSDLAEKFVSRPEVTRLECRE